jgi:hypothetical protein
MPCTNGERIQVNALVSGNIKDIVDQSTASQDEYLNRFDRISQYMYAMKLPYETMHRVRQWCQVLENKLAI